MTSLGRRLSNGLARALRFVRRTFFPGVDTRGSAAAQLYHRWVGAAARLDVVDDVQGHRMHLDSRDSLRLSVARLYEPVATTLFETEVRAGQTVLDLGANIGYFTLILARRVGPEGRVIAFEPDPTNFALLERNVAANGYANVSPVRRAVWSLTTPLHLFLSDDNRGDHRAYDTAEGRRSVTIDAVRVDDYFGEDPPRIDWIKMDVQGSELHALRGMRRVLENSPTVTIVTEFWPAAIARSGAGSPADFLRELVRLGFSFQTVDEKALKLVPTTAERLLAENTIDNGGSADVVCRRTGSLPSFD